MSHSPLEGPLDGHVFGAGQPCFGCGPEHPNGMRLTFEREGDEIVTRYTPRRDQQSAPNIMHGGLVATLADELAGWALLAPTGKFGFTVSFQARYARAVRMGVEIEGRGKLVSPPRRLADVDVRLLQEGVEVFTARVRFAVLDRAAAEKLLDGPIPDAWARFCR